MGLADVQRREIEYGRLLGDRTAVGKDRIGMFLQVNIVYEPEWLEQLHPVMEFQPLRLDTVACPRMGGDDDPLAILLGNAIQDVGQLHQIDLRIDIFFPVCAHDKIILGGQPKTDQYVRGVDLRHIGMKHLEHRAAGLDEPLRRQPFAKQIFPGNGAVGHVDVAGVVNNLPVGLLRHPLIETAVTCFHVKDRNFATLGRDCRKAAVGIAENKQGLGFLLFQHLVNLDDQLPDGLGGIHTCGIEEMIGPAHLQIVEEDLVQLIIIVLPRVDKNMIQMTIQTSHYPGKTDYLGTCPHHCHDFEFFHINSILVNGLKKRIRVFRVENFIAPHDRHQIGCAGITDVVGITGGDIHHFKLLPRNAIFDDLVPTYPAEADCPLAADNEKLLVLRMVPVVPLGNPRLRNIN